MPEESFGDPGRGPELPGRSGARIWGFLSILGIKSGQIGQFGKSGQILGKGPPRPLRVQATR